MGEPDRERAPLEDLDLPDHLRPGLDLVFVGINPGERSARTGHHYAHPSNRFFKALHRAGLTPRRLDPEEDHRLLEHGIGLTNVVGRPTREAAELDRVEYEEGLREVAAKVRRHRPRLLCINGKGAWEAATGEKVEMGLQDEPFEGALVYVAPSPSGRNAAYPEQALVEHYETVRRLSGETKEEGR